MASQLTYQTGINVTQPTNPGVLKGLLTAPVRSAMGTRTGQMAARQFGRQQQLNDWGQMSTAVQGSNAQTMMAAQKLRSEASQSGVQNLANIYSDFNERARNQAALNADISASNIGYSFGARAAALRRAANIARGNP
jgi:hypothetical protein